jgi:hypothetical protein
LRILDLKSLGTMSRAGSIPAPGTTLQIKHLCRAGDMAWVLSHLVFDLLKNPSISRC